MYESFLNKEDALMGRERLRKKDSETRKVKDLIATASSIFIYLRIKIAITQVRLV